MTDTNILQHLLHQRMQECHAMLSNLLCCQKFGFDGSLHCELPELHGIYAISTRDATVGSYVRAGRTKEGLGGLRQRIYRNHYVLVGSRRMFEEMNSAINANRLRPVIDKTFAFEEAAEA